MKLRKYIVARFNNNRIFIKRCNILSICCMNYRIIQIKVNIAILGANLTSFNQVRVNLTRLNIGRIKIHIAILNKHTLACSIIGQSVKDVLLRQLFINRINHFGFVRVIVFLAPVSGIICLAFRFGFSTNKHFCPCVPQITFVIWRVGVFVLAGICRKHTPLSICRILCFAGRLKCIGYILVLHQLPLVAAIVTFHKSVCFACLCVIKQVIHMFFFFFICRPALGRLVIQRRVIGVKVLLGLAVNLVLHIFCYTIHIIFHVIFAGVTILFYPVAGIIFVTGRACYRTNQNVFSIKPQIARVIRRLRVFPLAGISRKYLALTISGVLCLACSFQRIQRFLICHFYPATGFCFLVICPLPAFLAVGVIKQIAVVRFLCGVVFPTHSRPALKRRVIVIKILFNLAIHLFLQLVNLIHIIF